MLMLEQLVSDNDPQFTPMRLQSSPVKHTFSVPYHLVTKLNAQVERFVQTFKQAMKSEGATFTLFMTTM